MSLIFVGMEETKLKSHEPRCLPLPEQKELDDTEVRAFLKCLKTATQSAYHDPPDEIERIWQDLLTLGGCTLKESLRINTSEMRRPVALAQLCLSATGTPEGKRMLEKLLTVAQSGPQYLVARAALAQLRITTTAPLYPYVLRSSFPQFFVFAHVLFMGQRPRHSK